MTFNELYYTIGTCHISYVGYIIMIWYSKYALIADFNHFYIMTIPHRHTLLKIKKKRKNVIWCYKHDAQTFLKIISLSGFIDLQLKITYLIEIET